MKTIETAISLVTTERTDERLLQRMKNHYSQPKGFVGRNICYAIYADDKYYGHIVAGSATRFLPGRNDFLKTDLQDLNNIVNNIFFNVSCETKYPFRNFTSAVVKHFVKQASTDWLCKYGDVVYGFETLIEKPRTGELYLKAGWKVVGETVGYTCKRIGGKGGDSYTGKRVWNTKNLRPKLVLCYNLREL